MDGVLRRHASFATNAAVRGIIGRCTAEWRWAGPSATKGGKEACEARVSAESLFADRCPSVAFGMVVGPGGRRLGLLWRRLAVVSATDGGRSDEQREREYELELLDDHGCKTRRCVCVGKIESEPSWIGIRSLTSLRSYLPKAKNGGLCLRS